MLLVDDDAGLLAMLAQYLGRSGHAVRAARSAEEAQALLGDEEADVVVLDVTMPGIDGFELLGRLRADSRRPVIMLSAHDEEPSVLKGFALGADDYVTKPFSFAQLEARIRAVAGRARDRSGGGERPTLARGDLRLDLQARRVQRGGENIKLTPTEFRLLAVLMQQPGKIYSARQLVREIWGDEYLGESDYVRRYVWYLRQKIETNPDEPRYIRNERNAGYFFSPA